MKRIGNICHVEFSPILLFIWEIPLDSHSFHFPLLSQHDFSINGVVLQKALQEELLPLHNWKVFKNKSGTKNKHVDRSVDKKSQASGEEAISQSSMVQNHGWILDPECQNHSVENRASKLSTHIPDSCFISIDGRNFHFYF